MNAEVNNTAPDVVSTWILDLMLQNQAKLTAETTQWFIIWENVFCGNWEGLRTV